jgi:hypothetical protein
MEAFFMQVLFFEKQHHFRPFPLAKSLKKAGIVPS